MSDARLPNLGRRQRLVMESVFDHGCWSRDAGWYVGSVRDTERICRALAERGMLEVDTAPDRAWFRYLPTGAGWAWLIMITAADLRGVGRTSKAWKLTTGRLGHLAAAARLAADGPVNWRGERV